MPERLRVLLLGGTGDAATLSKSLAGDTRIDLTTSLAGRTRAPAALSGQVRRGGFGGLDGLADYLGRQTIDILIDATHPYAARISDHAAQASAQRGIACLRLDRPAWPERLGDRWIKTADILGAVDALRDLGPRVFLTVGRQELAPFAALRDRWFLVRTIEAPEPGHAVPRGEIMLARGPFNDQDECGLLKDKAIDVVVSKNSGGDATYPKIAAARKLGLPVVMIDRPRSPLGPTATTLAEVLAWLDAQVSLRCGRSRRLS